MFEHSKDQDYLGRIQDYYAKWRVIPSYTRLCEILGLASRSAVGKVLNRLLDAGYLTRTEAGDWAPSESFFERPLSGFKIPAGSPAHTPEASLSGFQLDAWLVNNPSKTYFLPVKGDSMIGAGIFDGDLAVIERRTQARSGEIVVAFVDGEYTLKTLIHDKGTPALRPENPSMDIIRPQGSLEVHGVMVGLVRRYSPKQTLQPLGG